MQSIHDTSLQLSETSMELSALSTHSTLSTQHLAKEIQTLTTGAKTQQLQTTKNTEAMQDVSAGSVEFT